MKLIKGSFIYSIDKDNIEIKENQYLLIRDGKSEEFYKEIPSRLKNIQIEDYGDNIIIPGLIDLHIHAPQYAFRGMGMDMQLLDWLNTYAFKEEGKYRDLEYAKKQYSKFVSDVKNSATTIYICNFTQRCDNYAYGHVRRSWYKGICREG